MSILIGLTVTFLLVSLLYWAVCGLSGSLRDGADMAEGRITIPVKVRIFRPLWGLDVAFCLLALTLGYHEDAVKRAFFACHWVRIKAGKDVYWQWGGSLL